MTRMTPAFPTLLVLLTLFLFASPGLAQTENLRAGSVRSVHGDVQLLREGRPAARLAVGDRIYERDVIITGKDATLGLVMRDNATLSLGANSKLIIQQYLFEPDKGRLASLLRLSRGSLGQVSGLIAKVRPEAARVQSPVVTIGIRGTYFAISVPEGLEETFPPIEEAR